MELFSVFSILVKTAGGFQLLLAITKMSNFVIINIYSKLNHRETAPLIVILYLTIGGAAYEITDLHNFLKITAVDIIF